MQLERRHTIRPRRPDLAFDDVPVHWFLGNVFATHFVNSLNLLFPSGERFFVRSVRHFLDRIEEPALRSQVAGFLAQEARHGLEHERFFARLEAQGFDVQKFLSMYERVAWGKLEPMFSPEMRLAVTVALEHYTASFAHLALTRGVVERVHPAMRDLLLWHAAEEIEHKSVAYDVLQAVAPGYATRAGGMILATIGLLGFWIIGLRMFFRQDPAATRARVMADRRAARANGYLRPADLARAFWGYLRPGFHPWKKDDLRLAMDYLGRAMRAAAGEATT